MNLRKAIAIGLAVVCSSGNAGAAEVEGVRFSDALRVGDTQLRLHGTGLLRYRVFIKGYVAALYLAAHERVHTGESLPAGHLEF